MGGMRKKRRNLSTRLRRLEQKYKRLPQDHQVYDSGSGIIGDNTDYGGAPYMMSGNTKVGVWGSLFDVPSGEAWDITQIKAKIKNEFSYNFRYGIYKLVNGYSTAELVAYTASTNVQVFGTIVTLNLTYPSSTVTLGEGSYLFCIFCEGGIGVYGGTYSGQTERHGVGDTWSDGLSDPFGSGGSQNSNFSRTIYAEYTWSSVLGEED